MCGICGSLGGRVAEQDLRSATDLMWHRGPDESGFYCRDGVALGMRRLSIIDLAGGTQPKTNETGSIQVIFNGEIYNFETLKADLAARGHVFTSHSDTEVIGHAYEEWGPDCFAKLNGIFGIALWDGDRRRLLLARDHLGVKPLYYARMGDQFVFGSELKPVLALLPELPAIDEESVALFLRYQYVPGPRTIFRGVYKLQPAHYLITGMDSAEIRLVHYWRPDEIAGQKLQNLTRQEAEDRVDVALRQAVERQMISDVPLGAFLSGGIDSSAVVAAMQQVSSGSVKTFSIGFQEDVADESRFAELVAKHLGTDHHTWVITERDALAVLPKLVHYYDEPFADPSAIPTYLVSQLARRHVTVSLSGDGGDELFSGYSRYAYMRRIAPLWTLPSPVRQAGLLALKHVPGRAGHRFARVGEIASHGDKGDAYRYLISVVPDRILAATTPYGSRSYQSNAEWPSRYFRDHSLDEAMMLTDLETYLPDAILTKVDRASMAHSLEARVPLLDPRFVELALTLPIDLRLSQGPKTLLRNVLKRYVPAELVDRPKHGFGIPVHEWLRGGLRETIIDYLSPDLLRQHNLLNTDGVQKVLTEHLAGGRDRGYSLWAILMFQMWYHDFYHSLAHHPSRVEALGAGRER